MKLHSLKPAEGSTKSKKRVGRGQGLDMEELLLEVTRVRNQDLVIRLK